VLDEESKKNVKTVQLSNNTVKRIVQGVSTNKGKTIGTATLIQVCFFVSRKGGEISEFRDYRLLKLLIPTDT
jgi:DNA-binding Xre family transcriptional regulator